MLRWLSGILCVLCLFPACRRTQEEASLAILFTGDVLLDRSIRPMAERRGTAWLFNNVTPVFRQADAVVINLECPLTTRTTPLNKRFIFRGEPEWAKDLRQVGITHAAMANNHTNDQGRQGLADTYQALHTSGITPLGYGYSMEEQLTPTVIRKRESRWPSSMPYSSLLKTGSTQRVSRMYAVPPSTDLQAESDNTRQSILRRSSWPYCTGAQNSNPIPTYSNVITLIN